MASIAGVSRGNQAELVGRMLEKMSHRGKAWQEILEKPNTTIGINGTEIQAQARQVFRRDGIAKDGFIPGRFAEAQLTSDSFHLKRDPIGAAPLYYGWTADGVFCFASEVKGLLEVTQDIHELPPGSTFDGRKLKAYYEVAVQAPLDESPPRIALKLRSKLEASVEQGIGNGDVGSWLSGGLDSSIMASLASQFVENLHTFAAGIADAPDLTYARIMADAIHATHHEVVIQPEDLIKVLPEVIFYLETFDALLIRSSLLNYLVAKAAADYVPAVFSGEGGDELFAGYEYLKALNPSMIQGELTDIIRRLHNTALQRVDRCASAHGIIPRVSFVDPEVVDFALKIPTEYKLRYDVEKWILRQAVSDLLPEAILNRTKAKFWEGGGVEDHLARYAETQVSDHDFEQERRLPNGWVLNTKEELLYYRYFKDHFGELPELSWMGRTKGAPVS